MSYIFKKMLGKKSNNAYVEPIKMDVDYEAQNGEHFIEAYPKDFKEHTKFSKYPYKSRLDGKKISYVGVKLDTDSSYVEPAKLDTDYDAGNGNHYIETCEKDYEEDTNFSRYPYKSRIEGDEIKP